MVDAEDDEALDEITMSSEDYEETWTTYNKMKKAEDKAGDDDEETTESVDWLEAALDGRYIVDPPEDENDESEEKVGIRFLDDTKVWNSGAANFGYGKVLISQPAKPCSAIVFEKGKPRHVSINVKGRDRIDKLNKARIFVPSTLLIVPNEEKSWYVDNNFSITEFTEEEVVSFFEGEKDIQIQETKMIEYLTDLIPEKFQTTIVEIDEWHRKIAKSTKKNNHIALIASTVNEVVYKEDGSATIELSDDSMDESDFSVYDEEDGEGKNPLGLNVKVDKSKVHLIDFDEDSEILILAEVYRGDKYDFEARKAVLDKEGKKIPADMPSANAWGFIADPYEKNERSQAATVSEEDFDSEDDEDTTEEEIDDDYEVSDD